MKSSPSLSRRPRVKPPLPSRPGAERTTWRQDKGPRLHKARPARPTQPARPALWRPPASDPLAPHPGSLTPPHRLLGDARQHAGDGGEHLPHGVRAVAAAATPNDPSSAPQAPPSLLQVPGADVTTSRQHDATETTSCASPGRGPTRTAPRACPAHLRPAAAHWVSEPEGEAEGSFRHRAAGR